MQNNQITISKWASSLIKDMRAQLGGQISFSESDVIDGALFLMCILPASSYVSIENHLIEMSKEGSVLLNMEEEIKALHAFKSMYSLDECGRRKKYHGLICVESEDDGEA